MRLILLHQTLTQSQDQGLRPNKLYHADANYNLKIKLTGQKFNSEPLEDIRWNSNGTIFTDHDELMKMTSTVYIPKYKKVLEEERLKLTASIRYDGAQNFDGNYSLDYL